MDYDVVVIGGGAAGLSAALVLARARRRVAVIDAGEPRNAPAAQMHGFLSRDGMRPAHLLAVGRGEVIGYGGDIVRGRVRRIEPGFVVHSGGAPTLTARAVLVTTGLRDELPDIPGVRERWGTDVVHCPYCHGYEVRDAPIGVLGGEERDASMHQVLLVRQWSADVIFFPGRLTPTAEDRERLTARGIRIVDGDVARLVVTDDRLSAVELSDGRLVPRTAVFVAPRFVPHDDLLTDLGCAVDENGWVSTDPAGATSVPGVWAAGNVVNPRAQVITAAGAGSTAAAAINGYLVEDDIARSRRLVRT
ncbi:MAG TPA: NAD(P)/FAD-dependent oxidoreductase [Actinophytocola sp.]|uniref:NAD(P)/FAD-dependent oxidoreductase n=1 Tax=Actinophytocola sp. TaxID=1872138 RepID=UPI002DDC9BDA|nr:NAD(P)/FAD-dependent oxidoreductase [Actinophytocola sp.]HEV2783895.1 NAD(P)/FAD-dependent oxidoreductase [Actinophytocola sp.]